jgi:hypothetical protein
MASKPTSTTVSSVSKSTSITPVGEITGPGRLAPLNGLPDSSVLDRQLAAAQEKTRTKSKPASVRRAVKVSLTDLAPMGAIFHSQLRKFT